MVGDFLIHTSTGKNFSFCRICIPLPVSSTKSLCYELLVKLTANAYTQTLTHACPRNVLLGIEWVGSYDGPLWSGMCHSLSLAQHCLCTILSNLGHFNLICCFMGQARLHSGS